MKNYLIIGGNRGIGAGLVSKLKSEHRIFHYSRFSTEDPIDASENYNPKKFDVSTDDIDLETLPETIDGKAL